VQIVSRRARTGPRARTPTAKGRPTSAGHPEHDRQRPADTPPGTGQGPSDQRRRAPSSQVVLGQPLSQQRRHQQHLTAVTRNKISSHPGSLLNLCRQTRYSDSLATKRSSRSDPTCVAAGDRFRRKQALRSAGAGRLACDGGRRVAEGCAGSRSLRGWVGDGLASSANSGTRGA
jgi:hypothetical protein